MNARYTTKGIEPGGGAGNREVPVSENFKNRGFLKSSIAKRPGDLKMS